MKNVLNALRMSVLFVILILMSCGKKTSPVQPAEPPKPPSDDKLQISATAPTSKVFFGDPASGSVTTNFPATITANPGIVVGGIYTIPSVTGQMSVKLSASSANGQTAETTVVLDCWSPKHSLLFKNGKWNGTTINIGNGIPSAWLYGVTFRTDLKSVVTPVGGVDGVPSPFNFDEGNMLLTFSAKTWNVVTLTETDLVLSRINADNELVVTSYRH